MAGPRLSEECATVSGFVGYYRRFIPKFADIATPLVHLTGEGCAVVWDTSCSAAFRALRASLIDAPILGLDNIFLIRMPVILD